VATHVLRRLNITQPPVPIYRIALELGIEIVPDADLDVAGVVVATDRVAKITLNTSDPDTRRRFTIAHEIGHLLLHTIGPQPQFRFSDPGFGPTKKKIESEANEFAASLLMPLWLVEPLATGARRTARQLADLFEVSQKAMEVQLSKLLSR
jgi:Zn-dependent peptidase ImmA (M78 family)